MSAVVVVVVVGGAPQAGQHHTHVSGQCGASRTRSMCPVHVPVRCGALYPPACPPNRRQAARWGGVDRGVHRAWPQLQRSRPVGVGGCAGAASATAVDAGERAVHRRVVVWAPGGWGKDRQYRGSGGLGRPALAGGGGGGLLGRGPCHWGPGRTPTWGGGGCGGSQAGEGGGGPLGQCA